MIVISDDVVLTAAQAADGINANNPRIGWHNVITDENVAASSEDSEFPATNLGNPASWLKWKAASAVACTVQTTLGSAEIVNYLGIAGHNFGTTGTAVKLQQSFNGSVWADLTEEMIPADDYALMFEFADTVASLYYRLVLTPSSGVPEIGALNIGRVLRMQRRVYVGYEPPTLNRKTEVSSGHSEAGQFLGRVRRRQMLEGAVPFKNLTAAWVRAYFDDFQVAAETLPFFFAWRPDTYPDEVAYMWLTSDPVTTNEQPNGMMTANFKYQGIR